MLGGGGGAKGARRKSSWGGASGSVSAAAAAAAALETCYAVLKAHAGSGPVAAAVGKLLLTVNADAVPGLLETRRRWGGRRRAARHCVAFHALRPAPAHAPGRLPHAGRLRALRGEHQRQRLPPAPPKRGNGQRQGDKAPRARRKCKQFVDGGRADGALTCPGRAPKGKCKFFQQDADR